MIKAGKYTTPSSSIKTHAVDSAREKKCYSYLSFPFYIQGIFIFSSGQPIQCSNGFGDTRIRKVASGMYKWELVAEHKVKLAKLLAIVKNPSQSNHYVIVVNS